MSPKKLPTVWNAPPHTIAKIEMLRAYLVAWFQILGRSRRGQELLYVDGFAGPGEYSNYSVGSPVAALSAAREALDATGSDGSLEKFTVLLSKQIKTDTIICNRRLDPSKQAIGSRLMVTAKNLLMACAD